MFGKTEAAEIPLYEIGGYKIEIHCLPKISEKSIVITGKKKILKHSTNETIISTGDEIIAFSGGDLKCETYTNGGLEVKGNIFQVNFERKNENA